MLCDGSRGRTSTSPLKARAGIATAPSLPTFGSKEATRMSRLDQGFKILRTAVAVALLAAAGLAQAAVAPSDQDRYSIPLRQFDLFNYTSAAVEQAKAEAAASFASVN